MKLRLFVAGRSSRSSRAEQALEALRREAAHASFDIEVIDVLERPDLADEARVLATPMVLRTQPQPERRVVGDLSDLDGLARALDVEISLAFHGGGVA